MRIRASPDFGRMVPRRQGRRIACYRGQPDARSIWLVSGGAIAHRCGLSLYAGTKEATMLARARVITRAFGGGFAVAVAVQCALVADAGAQPDAVAAFYRGRTVQAIVGYTPGSTFELYLRTVTRYLGHHIPGQPNIVVQHMPGAGSLNATANLAAVAPRDGSVIGMINPVNTTEPLIDPVKTRFDPRAFQWLGSLNTEISTCGFWAKDLKTLADLKRREIVVGSTGPASGSTIDAKVLGPLAGINFKVVTGYPGLTEVRLAAERGEVDGHCGLLVSALKTDLWEAYRSGRVVVPVQMALQKHRELPDVPNAYDLATREEDRQLFRLIFGPWAYGRPLLAPPGTPADRVAALRAALKATVADPQFVAETKRINMEIQLTEADAIARLIDDILRTPEPVVERARVLLGVQNR
jgi:tripartite-type tricarboxylate transporter receptor subunit TctC